MENEPLVSVIIPAYNCEKYIERCIDSVLRQECKKEIIVVNDGSTDGTLEKLSKYKETIKLLSIENAGAASARNVALQKISGEFVVFIDADDYFKNDALIKLLEKQKETDADIIRFSHKIIYPDGRIDYPKEFFSKSRVVEKNEFKKTIYPQFICGIGLNSVCMGMYRRSCVEGNKFPVSMQTAEDAMFNLQCYTRAKKVFLYRESLYCYFKHREGLTGKSLSVVKKYINNFKLSAKIFQYLKEWEMDTLCWKVKVLLRPIKLTFNKLRRLFREIYS